jgi:Arc/MetJ-type ribon-helix-helix transcriptional regulator
LISCAHGNQSPPPDLERSALRHLSSGQYQSAEDVLRAALYQFDKMNFVSLRQSEDDEKAGRLVSHESAAAVRQKHGFDDARQ